MKPDAMLSMTSPVGPLYLGAREDQLTHVLFAANGGPELVAACPELPDHPLLKLAATQLREYFAGSRRTFALPLGPTGTPFQMEVWQALATIPYGTTLSYGALAARVGRPGAYRAVGAANGRNPLSIVLPCHRVIGRDGSLTGYGGGLDIKAWLLRREEAFQDPVRDPVCIRRRQTYGKASQEPPEIASTTTRGQP